MKLALYNALSISLYVVFPNPSSRFNLKHPDLLVNFSI